jgi:hypothetical protein
MTEKSGRKGSEKKTPQNNIDVVKKKRGRPKGSKNKAKVDNKEIPLKEIRKRGRPKGSKNKPKNDDSAQISLKGKYPKDTVTKRPNLCHIAKPTGKRGRPKKQDTIQAAPHTKTEEQKVSVDATLTEHPLFKAIVWLEKKMHHNELQYYRSRASKIGATLQVAIASDILGFFNVQDAELCKQVKKNTFIASVTKHELH